jgi:hypothetical protein
MAGEQQTPIEAEDLLRSLRRSIARGQVGTALTFVSDSNELAEHLAKSSAKLREAAASVGTLPPSPPTIRARVALPLVWAIQRLLWWHTETSKRLASAMCDFAGLQLDEQAQQRQRIEGIEDRLHTLEVKLQQMQKRVAGERL